jgi:hypothetical protein
VVQAGGRGHLHERGAAAVEQAEARRDLAPERVVDDEAGGLAAERRQDRGQRALAAVGHGAQVGRGLARRLETAADRRRHLRGRKGALEGVGGDEDVARDHPDPPSLPAHGRAGRHAMRAARP